MTENAFTQDPTLTILPMPGIFVISGLSGQPAERNGQGLQRAESPCGERGRRLASGPDPLLGLPRNQR